MKHFDFTEFGLKEPQKVFRIHTGASSVNYHIQNADGEFLIKILKDHQEAPKNRLLKNMACLSGEKYCPHILFEKKFPKYHVLVYDWIEGESPLLEKLPLATFKQTI